MPTPESKARRAPGNDQPTVRRGGTVDVNARRIGRVAMAVILAGLAVLTVVLYVAGAHKNSQINELRQHGVHVHVTVTGCQGLLGGSGSNEAGFTCKVALTMDGHRSVVTLPGSSFYRPGTRLNAVAVPGDPALISPPRTVASEHASGRVFILPTVLLLVLLAVVALLLFRRRRA